jgi:tRNA(adenine34) deaminase
MVINDAVNPDAFNSDEYFMSEAVKQAGIALSLDEVPIGAVVVCSGKIIARGYNMTQRLNDVTAHAEMIAITAASNNLNSKYLDACTLYVTLEPCLMCAGACSWAHFERIVFGSFDPKKGYTLYASNALHPKTKVTSRIHEEICSRMLKDYFRSKRT